MKLKKFKIDKSRTKLVVPVEFYQMNLIRAVESARREDPTLFADGNDMLPSWSKFAKDPVKAKGLWTRMLQAVFLGQGNMPELDVDYQTKTVSNFQVAMMFMPGSLTIKDDNLKNVVEMTKQTLKGWEVLEISGGGVWNGKKVNDKKAEQMTKEAVEKCKETDTPLLILSRGMAQRSYSVGEITSLFLCYDEGDAGATTQKISRALTPHNEGKVGRIFSLSFDPNRDDKFDSMMIATAQNYAKRKDVDIDEALRRVIGTIDIFATTEDGRVDIDHDTYLQQILDRNSLGRMVGKQANTELLSMDEATRLVDGNGNYSRLSRTDKADKGKTTLDKKKKDQADKPLTNEEVKIMAKVRETLTNIVEHLPYLAIATNTTTVKASLEACAESEDYTEYVTTEFGVSPAMIIDLFDRGVLNYDMASLLKTAKTQEIEQLSAM